MISVMSRWVGHLFRVLYFAPKKVAKLCPQTVNSTTSTTPRTSIAAASGAGNEYYFFSPSAPRPLPVMSSTSRHSCPTHRACESR